MLTLYYDLMFFCALGLTLFYMFIWHKHFDVHVTLLYVLVPVANFGYMMLIHAKTPDAWLAANKLTYVGGCFSMLLMMLAVFSLCHIRLNRFLRVFFLALSLTVFLFSLTQGTSSTVFYQDFSFALGEDGLPQVVRRYGLMHTVLQIVIIGYFALSLGAIVYCYFRKNQVSRKILFLLFLPTLICIISFFGGRRFIQGIELIPAAYVVALLIFLVISWRISLYDITDTGIDSLLEKGETGFISFDFKFNYLGSNETAKNVFPALRSLTVDHSVRSSGELEAVALPWLQAFAADEKNSVFLHEIGEKTYQITVSYLYTGKLKRGYQFFITDDTTDRQYIRLLDDFNRELQQEVAAKTAHIEEMHNQLVLGMATMVESRDNSTGGHIRRTSVGVRLLIREMQKDPAFRLTEGFCQRLIKAAPMHDLGKIAVDDAILRKPGRFTPEEFESMKAHAAEGARIVREILKDTDDIEFQLIAENVAHYHHERWDGSGYPEGLRQEEIPFEARIMAVADVYDALVSKRAYKDKMPLDQAHAIIMEGMGKHFDPQLEKPYLAAREHLEQYYLSLE